MGNLRKRLIRLAYVKPELRTELLHLLKTSSRDVWIDPTQNTEGIQRQVEKYMLDGHEKINFSRKAYTALTELQGGRVGWMLFYDNKPVHRTFMWTRNMQLPPGYPDRDPPEREAELVAGRHVKAWFDLI